MSTFSVVSSVVAIKVGILVSSFLFGAATIQAFFYYSNYPKDPMHIKIFSAVVWGLELFGMIFSTHLLYSAAVEPYLNAPILMFLNPPYQILATILVGNWSGIVVQIYFLDRVRRFTKQIWPIIPCILLILYTFASTIPVVVICGTRGLAEFTLNWRWLSISGMFVSAFIDLFLAGMLCWNLALQRRSAFTRSATMIDRIIVMTLTTGLITRYVPTKLLYETGSPSFGVSIVAVLAAVLSIALPYELIYLGVYICLARG
ncbi:hypothetical protein ONZ45_g12788 [Pleurotus djamor]|nr:hypothetical protein ONZ45_g12788 [Pleurotus djamor]